ncbi:hypothetical protein ABW20_dc0109450 [Dactylellina cionopaga]|nr:hypothetical protein ABW20_dc0109450 [Dactylellina cionopaga]
MRASSIALYGPWILLASRVTANPVADIAERAICNRDNCLRGLIDSRWISIGLAYCQSVIRYDPGVVVSTIYTTPVVTTTQSVVNPQVITTTQTLETAAVTESNTQFTNITADNAPTRRIYSYITTTISTTSTIIEFTATTTQTLTYDNKNWSILQKRDVVPTPTALLKTISSCSSRISSACSCLTSLIAPSTRIVYLPGPVTTTTTSYETLAPDRATKTSYSTVTTTETETSVYTILTITSILSTFTINRYTAVATTTLSQVFTVTETSCIYSPTDVANGSFDTVDTSWSIEAGISNSIQWTIDGTNPRTGGKSGHIKFTSSGSYGFFLDTPIPQLCPWRAYRVSLWAINAMNGWPGQCNMCGRLGASWGSCTNANALIIGSTWTQWTVDIVFPNSGPAPQVVLDIGCSIGGGYPYTRNVDVWIDDFTIIPL